MSFRWLIVEDSIQGKVGHWYQYLQGFVRDLPVCGDAVSVLGPADAEPFVVANLGVKPVLPKSIFLQMTRRRSRLERMMKYFSHPWKMERAVRRSIGSEGVDLVFVPTTTLHHLLAWWWLLRVRTVNARRVLLFFPGLPVRSRADGVADLASGVQAWLFRAILRSFSVGIERGRVMLGVETHAMQQAANSVFGVPFRYLPHPVAPHGGSEATDAETILVGAYGAPRFEKGSDLVVAAIEQFLRRFPATRCRFAIQWTADCADARGHTISLPAILKTHPHVQIIDHYFAEGDYERQMARTSALLLPYRKSYARRVSRVVVEALVEAKPAIVTAGTTLSEQLAEWGAGKVVKEEDVDALVDGLAEMEREFDTLRAAARSRREPARAHFSVMHFRKLALEGLDGGSPR